MKKTFAAFFVCLVIIGFCFPTLVLAAFQYEHDPMENPKASKDIVVNPDAVYGYSPDPDSTRLGEFADAIDWTDETQVAAAREQRAEYLAKNEELYQMIDTMKTEGKDIEEIARAVSKRRNELRLESYDGDPDGLERVKKSNLDTYGNEEGPTPESLYEKYGSWGTVLEKALSSNPGMDACLGFYDDMYYKYDIASNESAGRAGAADPSAAKPDSAHPDTSPKTGDNSSMIRVICISLIVLCACAAVFLYPGRKTLPQDKEH